MEQTVEEDKKMPSVTEKITDDILFFYIKDTDYLLKFLSAASISMGAVLTSAEPPLGSVS